MKRVFDFISTRGISLVGGVVLTAILAISPLPSIAQDEMAPEDPAEEAMPQDETVWQDVITGQIEAFRAGDAAGALEFAGAMFQANYEDPEAFMSDILDWGYAPILESSSHSFGTFRAVAPGRVVQVVQVIGSDQGYYQAVYQMTREDDGWRVHSVSLGRQEGLGV